METQTTDRLSQVKECIAKGITKSKDIAATTGIHPSYVARLIKQANDPDHRLKGEKYKNASKIVKKSKPTFGFDVVIEDKKESISLLGQGQIGVILLHKEKFEIRLMAILPSTADEDIQKPFHWITLRNKFDSMEDAKKWVNNNEKGITKQFTLYIKEEE
jgi:hypothetical protein